MSEGGVPHSSRFEVQAAKMTMAAASVASAGSAAAAAAASAPSAHQQQQRDSARVLEYSGDPSSWSSGN